MLIFHRIWEGRKWHTFGGEEELNPNVDNELFPKVFGWPNVAPNNDVTLLLPPIWQHRFSKRNRCLKRLTTINIPICEFCPNMAVKGLLAVTLKTKVNMNNKAPLIHQVLTRIISKGFNWQRLYTADTWRSSREQIGTSWQRKCPKIRTKYLLRLAFVSRLYQTKNKFDSFSITFSIESELFKRTQCYLNSLNYHFHYFQIQM
jgi:hypothetical protein